MRAGLCADVRLNGSNFDFGLKSSLTPFFHRALQLSFAFVFICYRKLSWYRVCLLVFSFLKEMENKMRNTLNDIYFGKTKDIVNSLR